MPSVQGLTLLGVGGDYSVPHFDIMAPSRQSRLGVTEWSDIMSTSAKVRATTTAQSVDLATLRTNVAESEKRAYGAKREYAKGLNTLWSFDWFTLTHDDTSDEGKAVRSEKTEFYEVLKKAGHTNPSKVWGDIKRYGNEERYGAPESEGAGNSARPLDTRNVEELRKLYKANHAEGAEAKHNNFANALAKFAKDHKIGDITK